MITLERVTKRFERRTVVDDVSLRLERCAVSALIGPSGSGKSTLLRCINGLVRFDAGRVRVGDVELGPATPGSSGRDADRALSDVRRKVGMVFQDYGLFSHMTALANVMEAPVHVRGLPTNEARERAESWLARFGLLRRKSAYPRELSGGEQQRVAIARALAMEPEVLLLDEPTSALDPERKADVVRIVAELATSGTTLVIVTHEPELLRGVADRAVLLRHGRVVADGSPKDLLREADLAPSGRRVDAQLRE